MSILFSDLIEKQIKKKMSFIFSCAAILCYILSSIMRTFYIKNDAEMFPVHYTWKVAEKRFKIAFMMNKLAMINSCEIILEK